jgi:ABC-type proline/glycine betaine transport system permease subunit
VFVSFFAGLAAMARFAWREGRWLLLALNTIACVVVTFTIAVDIDRGWPLLALAATALIGAVLYGLWVRSGRPTGIEQVERHAEAEEGDE